MFNRMCNKMPHLAPKLINTKFRLVESTYFDDKPSLFNIIKREHYIKTNGKTCYVDTFIKQIEVDRKFVTMPKGDSWYKWIVKKKFVDDILKQHGCINIKN